jgi:hypothetical protein
MRLLLVASDTVCTVALWMLLTAAATEATLLLKSGSAHISEE